METPNAVAPQPHVKELADCFRIILNKEQLYLSMDNLTHLIDVLLMRNHDIRIYRLNRRLVNVLADALIHFMTVWPGWEHSHEFYAGSLKFDAWLTRFRRYLIDKLNYIVEHEGEFAREADGAEREEATPPLPVIDTNAVNSIPIAPYTLHLSGPPKMLNNVYFVESGGDVLMKQHTPPTWRDLTVTDVCNWPYISAEIKLPHLHIVRKNLHDVQRFLSLDVMSYTNHRQLFHIRRVNEERAQVAYTHAFIATYVSHYIEFLAHLNGVRAEKLLELRSIIDEFLIDIKEANVDHGTMATNTAVCYNIGNSTYIRNKKVDNKTDLPNINFYEILVPKVEFSLVELEDAQDLTDPNVSFNNLNSLKRLTTMSTCDSQMRINSLVKKVNHNAVTFVCELCKLTFLGVDSLLMYHLRDAHGLENSVFCQKCLEKFEVSTLCRKRWHHICSA